MRFSNASKKSSLNRQEYPCKMKPAHPLLHFPMSEEVIKDTSLMSSSNITINNNITLTISNTMVASPLKVAGDQHRTHLKLKEGLRAIIAI